MNPLDPRLLDALRADHAVPAEARARVRARLETTVPEMRRGPRGGGGGSGDGRAGVGALGARTFAIAAFVAGGLSGAALLSVLAGGPSARLTHGSRPSPEMPAAAVAFSVEPIVLEPDQGPPAPSAPSVIPPAPGTAVAPSPFGKPVRPRPSVPASAPRGSGLAAERLLLDEARAGLLQGDSQRAIERLGRHSASFPNGTLAEERDAMRIEALSRVGRPDEARALANAFRERWSDSVFLPTVDATIAAIP